MNAADAWVGHGGVATAVGSIDGPCVWCPIHGWNNAEKSGVIPIQKGEDCGLYLGTSVVVGLQPPGKRTIGGYICPSAGVLGSTNIQSGGGRRVK